MLRYLPFVLLVASSLFALSCANDTIVQTGQIIVEYDRTVDFSQFKTFSVVTSELAPPGTPEPGDDELFFNNLVNDLIIEAMTSEPVCMEFVPAAEATNNPPDLWAANGLARTTGEGTVWECVGGWWWGWWGWQWDPCRWVTPVPVEFDVGNLFIPVGPAPAEGEDPKALFAGIAQSVAGTGPDVETKVRAAVEAIFAQWPNPTSPCPSSQ
jgi:hypothetical protein